LLEIKRHYNPPISNTDILLPGCHSLHRFTITKSGPLGIFLEIENTGMVRVKSVTLNSLGDIYGLQENDILCKPLKNGALEKDTPTLSKCPFVIEEWRAMPT
jgi:hypothetical protein